MDRDFSEFFKQYEAIVAEVDAAFQAVKAKHPDCVTCQVGCSDCCYALFDLSLIEAMYINHKFNKQFQGIARSDLLDRADKADREAHKLKRKLFKASEEGRPAMEIMELAGQARIRCPLLAEGDTCDLYEARPVTCRLYGAPQAIQGDAHICGKSGFEPGKAYSTINVEAIQDKLMALSHKLVQSLNTRHTQMNEMLVPVSMALMTTYDDTFLGILKDEEPDLSGGAAITLDGSGSVSVEATPCHTCNKSESCQSMNPDSCGETPGAGGE